MRGNRRRVSDPPTTSSFHPIEICSSLELSSFRGQSARKLWVARPSKPTDVAECPLGRVSSTAQTFADHGQAYACSPSEACLAVPPVFRRTLLALALGVNADRVVDWIDLSCRARTKRSGMSSPVAQWYHWPRRNEQVRHNPRLYLDRHRRPEPRPPPGCPHQALGRGRLRGLEARAARGEPRPTERPYDCPFRGLVLAAFSKGLGKLAGVTRRVPPGTGRTWLPERSYSETRDSDWHVACLGRMERSSVGASRPSFHRRASA
jgi:hypothetical protein